jgi:hypothetical protein
VGGNALRTVDMAAAQVGATVEEIEALVAAGNLRVLAGADGRWITTARAVTEAAGGRPARPRRRPGRARNRGGASAAARGTSRVTPAPAAQRPVPAPPSPSAAPEAPAPAPAAATAPDVRTDVGAAQRLDVPAAAALLGLTPEATLRLMRIGRLRATRLGREWITTTRAVAEHRRRHRGR